MSYMCDHPEDLRLFAEAINFWGIEKQLNMLMEEIGELIVAINKWRRRKDKNSESEVFDMIEEMADTGLLIEQMRNYFGRSLYRKFRVKKMERLRKKLEEQKRYKAHTEEEMWGMSRNV